VLFWGDGKSEKRGQIERLEREPSSAFGGEVAQLRSPAASVPSRYACGTFRREKAPKLRWLYFVIGARGMVSSIESNCVCSSVDYVIAGDAGHNIWWS